MLGTESLITTFGSVPEKMIITISVLRKKGKVWFAVHGGREM